jgi:hypothetical protein
VIRAAALLAAVAVFLAAVGAAAGESEAKPMSNEDVVRMVAAGSPESEVLDAVRTRPSAFDVSEEMIQELRLAGVPESVLTAMKARAVPPAPPAADRPPRGTVRIAVTLGAKTLKCPAYADEDLKTRLHLPKETEERQVKDLAVFLACTTSEHVPDLWRGKTPLGRDMTGTSRHEMLLFVAGDTPEGKPPSLVLPDALRADVDDVEPHDLVLGVAARIGDRWYTLSSTKPLKVDVAKGVPALAGRVTKRGAFGFEVELKLGAKPKP